MSLRLVLCACILFGLLVLAGFTAGCGGRSGLSSPELRPREIDPAEFSLAALEQRPAPDGVSEADWQSLKTALRSALSEAKTTASTRAILSNSFPVRDLTAEPFTSAPVQLEWTFNIEGDYDLNGVVTISDLAPLGRYLGAVSTDANWSEARVADGNRDGSVTIADITPIGANFARSVDGFRVLAYPRPVNEETLNTNGTDAAFVEVARVPFIAGVVRDGSLHFSFAEPDGRSGYTYRLQTIQLKVGHPLGYYPGAYSNLAIVPVKSGPWPMRGHDPQRTYRTDVIGPTRANLKWTYAPAYYDSFDNLLATNDRLYFHDDYYGQLRWTSATVPDAPVMPLAPDLIAWKIVFPDGALLIMFRNGSLSCIELDGSERFWTMLDVGETLADSAMLHTDGNVYFYASIEGQNRLSRVTPQGEVSTVLTTSGLGRPAFFSNDDVLIVRGSKVERYDMQGERVAQSDLVGEVRGQPRIGSDDRVYLPTHFFRVLSPELETLYISDTAVDPAPFGYAYYPSDLFENIQLDEAAARIYILSYSGGLVGLDLEANVLWKRSVGNAASEPRMAGPRLSSGGAVQETDGGVVSYDPAGNQRWFFDTIDDAVDLTTSPDGTVLVSSRDGFLYVINADGSLRFEQRMSPYGESFTHPVTTASGSLYVMGQFTGVRRIDTLPTVEVENNWYFPQMFPPMFSLLLDHSGGLVGDVRIFSEEIGHNWMYRYGPDEQLRASLELPGPASGYHRGVNLLPDGASLHCIDTRLHAVSFDGVLLWSYDALDEIVSDPAVGLDGTIYIVGRMRGLVAVSSAGGELWVEPLEGETWRAGVAVNAARIHVSADMPVSGQASVYIFDRATHILHWRSSFGEKWVPLAPVLAADGTLYVAYIHVFGNGLQGELLKYEPSGSFSTIELTQLPKGVATLLDSAGNLFVPCIEGVLSLDAAGNERWWHDLPGVHYDLTELAIGPDGTLYVATGSSLLALAR